MQRFSARVSIVAVFILFSCDFVKKSHELIFSRYRVSTPAMSPTLNVGEVHAVFSSDTFTVNEIVTFVPPRVYRMENESVVWLHRLVGIPGDSLEMKKGVLFQKWSFIWT